MHDFAECVSELHDLVEELVEKYEFNDVLTHKICLGEWYDKYLRLTRRQASHIYITSGCTRMVFWDDDYCDYVYKIDFDEKDRNFTADERRLYEAAIEEDVDQFFAWISPRIDVKGLGFYGMEFCEIDDEGLSNDIYKHFLPRACGDLEIEHDSQHFTDEEVDQIDEWFGSDSGDSSWVTEYMAEVFGYDEYQKLDRFIDKHHIDDLHAGNWGRTEEGKYVITDYAGYGLIPVFAGDEEYENN